ncbi:MAG: T9SS type A sorting domain-containing protein [Thermaurantimonas sp.]
MKKRMLLSTLGSVLMLGGLMLYNQLLHTNQVYDYQPRISVAQKDNARGAAEWLHAIRANQITGVVDPADEIQAQQEHSKFMSRAAGLGLSWVELGPDNIGGRTRAFLQDKDNASLMFAGGVSGGLYRSTNAGVSWTPVNIMQENLAVVSICQTENGNIYYGTGESMYYGPFGTGAGGILGQGIFKSTDRGLTFQQLSSTVPTPNSTGADWVAVGAMVPLKGQQDGLLVGTNRGIRYSLDGGQTWTNPISGPTGTIRCTDLSQDKDGGVWASIGMRTFYSPDGINNWTEISKPSNQAGPTDLPVENGERAIVAVSPQDPNYVYVVTCDAQRNFQRAFRSTNKGQTWTVIGQRSTTFNPIDQGQFAMMLYVSPINRDKIFVGGLHLWEWSLTGGWKQISSSFKSPTNPFYVHVDQHRMVGNRLNGAILYATNDGGVFRSMDDGFTWTEVNIGYVTTQFYSVSFSFDGEIMGGTQDNGTLYVNQEGNTTRSGFRTNFIEFRGALRDGDGGYAEISQLDKRVQFKAMQYGILGRSNTYGLTYTDFYDFPKMDPNNQSTGLSPAFAPFVTPFLLWENVNDPFSWDSLWFVANPATLSLGFGQNRRDFSGTLPRPQAPAIFIPESFQIIIAFDTVKSNNQGVLSSPLIENGNFNATTGEFSVRFKQGVTPEILVKCNVRYTAGSVLAIESKTLRQKFNYTLTAPLEALDSVKIQDPVQSMFFVGLNSQANLVGGLFMTREALDFTKTPRWVRLGHFGTGTQVSALAVSKDGDVLFVGTNNGQLIRFTNLKHSRDSVSADLANANRQLQQATIRTFPGRYITSIAINPDNPNRVVVTLGNYGNQDYIFYSNNALAASPTFAVKSGNMPKFPVYSSVINYQNPNQVLVGTEYGIYSTADITAATVVWNRENEGMGNVPVFMLRQQRVGIDKQTGDWVSGRIYAGTHGRGMFLTSTLSTIGIKEHGEDNQTPLKTALPLYPNPAFGFTNVELSLSKSSQVEFIIRDLTGKTVKRLRFDQIHPEVKSMRIDVSDLRAGTYVVELYSDANFTGSSKLIIAK